MSGVVSTLGQGSVTQSQSVLLSGQEIASAQYFFEEPSGILATFSLGTLVPNYVMSNLELGSVITSATGTLVRDTTGNQEHALEGSGATFSAGSVSPTTPLSGQASTSAQGAPTVSWGQDLTGESSTSEIQSLESGNEEENTYILSSQGSATASPSQALSGSVSTLSQGDVVAVNTGKTEPLVGTQIDIEQSSVDSFFTWGISKALEGQSITTAQQNMGAPLTLPLAGESATVSKGFFGWDMKITGEAITSSTGTMIWVPSSENTIPVFGLPTITVGQGNVLIRIEDDQEGFDALDGSQITSGQGTLTARGTDWTPAGQPTSEWTPTSNPSSAWVRKDGPSTSWNREE